MASRSDPDMREAREERLAWIQARCRDRGLPLTDARQAVLASILDLGTHPTADEVLAHAAGRSPGIGRATVYRALEHFVRIGVLTKATHHGAAIRYDANVHPHHHLVCRLCDRIIDIEDSRLDTLLVPDISDVGFLIEDMQVQLRGICRNCQKLDPEELDQEEDS